MPVPQMPDPPLPTRRAAVAALALVLAGCGGGSVPPDVYYRLNAPADVALRAGGPMAGTVDVAPFRAEGLLNDRAIVYRTAADTFAGYSYHFWWAAPGALLQQSLVDVLRRAKAFDIVATPELRLDRTYEIVGRVRRLEHTGGAVAVEIELLLRVARSGAPLLFKTYTQDVRTADPSVPAAVAAFSAAVNAIWAAFLADLAGVRAPQPA
jgi:ABC-type uncharacterized transport system auxiliary subunit